MKLPEKLGLLYRAAHRRLKHRVGQASSRPFQQLRVLRVISRDQVATQAALAERLCIDPPAVSRLVNRLEQDGLLERRQGRDRRCVCLAATPAAEGELEILNVGVEWLESEMRRCLTPSELQIFERILEKLTTTLMQGESQGEVCGVEVS